MSIWEALKKATKCLIKLKWDLKSSQFVIKYGKENQNCIRYASGIKGKYISTRAKDFAEN